MAESVKSTIATTLRVGLAVSKNRILHGELDGVRFRFLGDSSFTHGSLGVRLLAEQASAFVFGQTTGR